VWHKRRWRCREALYARLSFTESIPTAVGCAHRPGVSDVAGAYGVSLPTAHTAFVHFNS
jgi:hypothetical protein